MGRRLPGTACSGGGATIAHGSVEPIPIEVWTSPPRRDPTEAGPKLAEPGRSLASPVASGTIADVTTGPVVGSHRRLEGAGDWVLSGR